MTATDPPELKRKLRAEGFEVYRTVARQVQLAERVRDNLIMDSGVAIVLGDSPALSVEVTVRAQASHFPGATRDQIWEHARTLAKEFTAAGYTEAETREAAVPDPNDPEHSLDTAHEIRLVLGVANDDALFIELRAALGRKRSTSDD